MKEKLGDTITVRQLLSHTSGLPDNFFEPATAGDHVGLSDVRYSGCRLLLNPGGKGATKQWSPNDIIADYFIERASRQSEVLAGKRWHLIMQIQTVCYSPLPQRN